MDQIKQDTLDLLQELRAADWDSALSGEHGAAEDVKISEKKDFVTEQELVKIEEKLKSLPKGTYVMADYTLEVVSL